MSWHVVDTPYIIVYAGVIQIVAEKKTSPREKGRKEIGGKMRVDGDMDMCGENSADGKKQREKARKRKSASHGKSNLATIHQPQRSRERVQSGDSCRQRCRQRDGEDEMEIQRWSWSVFISSHLQLCMCMCMYELPYVDPCSPYERKRWVSHSPGRGRFDCAGKTPRSTEGRDGERYLLYIQRVFCSSHLSKLMQKLGESSYDLHTHTPSCLPTYML